MAHAAAAQEPRTRAQGARATASECRDSFSPPSMEGGSEPHASIRMVRAEVAHGEPIFFLGATDTKNRLDAGKHCRTWIEVDVPPAEALKYQSRVDIALVSHAASHSRHHLPALSCADRALLLADTLCLKG